MKDPLLDVRSVWETLMDEALAAAEQAGREDEVPVGAVLVGADGQRLAVAANQPRRNHDPTAHAEIMVLRRAAGLTGNYRLPGTTLVVTIEPCLMCTGALLQARVARVVFGAHDSKAGALGSLYDLSRDGRLNHRLEVVSGVREDSCRKLIQAFFQERR